jgi:hypothetical protein
VRGVGRELEAAVLIVRLLGIDGEDKWSGIQLVWHLSATLYGSKGRLTRDLVRSWIGGRIVVVFFFA